jgi:hypothetical protein
MYSTLTRSLLLVLLAAPAYGQHSFPRVQLGATYANLRLPSGGTTAARHTGFSAQAGYNFTPWLGVENHLGIYSLGFSTTLIADVVSVRPTGRPLSGDAVVPFGVIGYGVGFITQTSVRYREGTVPVVRVAGGVEFLIKKPLSFRIDVGRLFLRSNIQESGINGTVGVAFNFSSRDYP